MGETDNDVGAAGRRITPDAARIVARYDTTMQIVKSVQLVGAIAVSYLPLRLLRDSIVALAGETTTVDAALHLSAYIGLGLTLTLAGAGWKVLAQRREIERLRRRIDDLERENRGLRNGQEQLGRSES
ncbi:MAG TPA: hypothetical protein VGA69_06015 [Nitriliruptorales bacterium]